MINPARNLTYIPDGIRECVDFLAEQGYEILDSGDGSSCEDGIDGPSMEPMVMVRSSIGKLFRDTDRVKALLHDRFGKRGLNIDGCYDSGSGMAYVIATGPTLWSNRGGHVEQ